jgi:hypothetical protein
VATRGLLGDYLSLLDRYRIVNQVLRISPEEARAIVDSVSQVIVGPSVNKPLEAGTLLDLHPLNSAIERSRAAVEDAVARSGRELPGPVLVGLFPTGLYNAQSRVEPHGYLVLVNRGLLHLLRRTARITVAATSKGPNPPFMGRSWRTSGWSAHYGPT